MNSKRILGHTLVTALTFSLVISSVTAAVNSEHYAKPNILRSNAAGGVRSLQRNAPRRRARTYDVQHYVIRTGFDVPNKTVIGEVDVTLRPLSNGFNTIDFDAAKMRILRVTLSDGTVLKSSMRSDILRIFLKRGYTRSETVTVKIKYRANPQRGLYFIPPSRADSFQRPRQIWTQGEPEDNHHWFPCYDFPDDKATSEQLITVGANEIAIANGTLVATINNPDGTRTFHWNMNQLHSSYLISLIAGDFTKLTDTYEKVALEYYTYPGTERLALRAFRGTPLMMRWLSETLGYPFPYDRYAQTIVGEFIFGGMENITATTLADTEILVEPGSASDSATINLISHELAHSWFGNLVTSRDWAHLWLNEGFATFLEAAYRESQDGRDVYLYELKKGALEYFNEDPARNRHPLVNPAYPLTMELFDATTYKKGAFVVHMLRETVGDEVFWRALNVYLNEYKYRTVDSRDLQRVFERVSGRSLEWFFDQWVYKAGYPELRVRASFLDTQGQLSVSVTQTQKADIQTPAVFRLSLDVEIETATGTRTERIEINRRTQDFVFQLDESPRSVTIDKGFRVLKKLFIPQSRLMIGFVILDGAEAFHRIDSATAFGEKSLTLVSSMRQRHTANSPSMFVNWQFTSLLFDRFNVGPTSPRP